MSQYVNRDREFLEAEIERLQAENENLSKRLTDFAKKIGEQRERATKYWQRAVLAENKNTVLSATLEKLLEGEK